MVEYKRGKLILMFDKFLELTTWFVIGSFGILVWLQPYWGVKLLVISIILWLLARLVMIAFDSPVIGFVIVAVVGIIGVSIYHFGWLGILVVIPLFALLIIIAGIFETSSPGSSSSEEWEAVTFFRRKR